MNRRDLLGRAGLAALFTRLLPGAALLAQSPGGSLGGAGSSDTAGGQRPDSAAGSGSAAGDPLYRPDLVQQRDVATAGDNDPVVKELEHRLKCTCGCNLDIYTCRTTDFTCTYSPALHKEVLQLRADGKDPDQVVAAFVAKYGEQILMAPPAEGFNLAGYLVPGAAVLAVGTLIGVMLLRRARMLAVAGPTGPAPEAPASLGPADHERLRQALSEVED